MGRVADPVAGAVLVAQGKHAREGIKAPLPDEVLDQIKAMLAEALIAEKSGSDHFYGAWKGGSARAGGGAADSSAGRAVDASQRWASHDELISEMSGKWGGEWDEIKKVPLPLANDAASTIDETFTRFGPSPAFRGVRSPDHGPGGVIAEVKRVNPAVKGSAVYLYGGYWHQESSMDALYKKEHGSKWNVSGGASSRDAYARSIVQHELGHQFMGLNLHARFGADRNEPVRKELEPWFHGTFLPQMKKAHVSQYARRNPHEAWAELFTGATGHGISQSHFVPELKAILDKHYPIKESVAQTWDASDGRVTVSEADAETGMLCGWAHAHPEIGEMEAPLSESLIGVLSEAMASDHFYGSWKGGSAKAGGHPEGGGERYSPKARQQIERNWERADKHGVIDEKGKLPWPVEWQHSSGVESGTPNGHERFLAGIERMIAHPDKAIAERGASVKRHHERRQEKKTLKAELKGYRVAYGEADLAESLIAILSEKSDDDHPYGAWAGGSKSSGGHPMSAQEQKAALAMRNPEAYSTRDTESLFFNSATGKWDDRRARQVHEPIINGWLNGVETTDEPVLYMTGGGMGSGKSTVLNSDVAGIPKQGKVAIVDPDAAKSGIPEYKAAAARQTKQHDPFAAGAVHEESSHIAKTAVARGLTEGHSVAYDTSGDSGPDKLGAKVAKFRAMPPAGSKPLKVFGEYAWPGSVAEAVTRSDARAKKPPYRFVPHSLLRANHRGVARSWVGAAQNSTFDRLRLWSTSGPFGSQPTLIAESVGGKVRVHNKTEFASFLKSGGMKESDLKGVEYA